MPFTSALPDVAIIKSGACAAARHQIEIQLEILARRDHPIGRHIKLQSPVVRVTDSWNEEASPFLQHDRKSDPGDVEHRNILYIEDYVTPCGIPEQVDLEAV